MPQRMAVCPNCGRAVYGNRVNYTGYGIEIDCPRCGLQERDMPQPMEDPKDSPWDSENS